MTTAALVLAAGGGSRFGRETSKLLVPFPSGELEAWTVSTLVNKADNNGPELLEPEPMAAEPR